MTAIRRKLRMLLASERGATAIEYGLIAALIALAMLSALASLGGGAGGMWTEVSDNVVAAM